MLSAKTRYIRFFDKLNADHSAKLITSKQYSEKASAFEQKLRLEAIAKAKYKIGDRITNKLSMQRIEITEIGADDVFSGEPWRYEVFYRGRKLNIYGEYTKIQPRMTILECRATEFTPKPKPSKSK